MKLITLALMALSAIAQTIVSDTIRVPISGALFNGRIVIAAPSMTFSGNTYARSQATVVVSNGVFAQTLIPNVGATPDTTSYLVQYYPTGGQSPWKEYWRVPNSTVPVLIYQVRVASEPASASGVAPWQINQNGATVGQALVWDGASWVPGAAASDAGPTGTFTRTFTSSSLIFINNVDHGFGNDRLVVDCYDAAGARLEPDSVSIDNATYQIQVRFVPAQAGSCIVTGNETIGRTFSQTFTAATSVTVPNVAQEIGTPVFVWRAYDATNSLVEPDSSTTDISGTLIVYFATAQTGRIAIVGR